MPVPSLLLIHGPATGAWLWEHWRREMAALGWQVNVLDLRGHGRSLPADLATVTLEDYVADLTSVAGQIEAAQGVHPIVGGWSTGALVAMMYAAQHQQTPGLLLLSPALPREAGGRAEIDAVRRAAGEILDPTVFGVFPEDRPRSRESLAALTDEELDTLLQRIAGERESGIAYRQTLRGVSIPAGAVQCPSLVLYAQDEFKAASDLAGHLGGETQGVPVEGRWGIVCHGQAVADAAPAVSAWLGRHFERK